MTSFQIPQEYRDLARTFFYMQYQQRETSSGGTKLVVTLHALTSQIAREALFQRPAENRQNIAKYSPHGNLKLDSSNPLQDRAKHEKVQVEGTDANGQQFQGQADVDELSDDEAQLANQAVRMVVDVERARLASREVEERNEPKGLEVSNRSTEAVDERAPETAQRKRTGVVTAIGGREETSGAKTREEQQRAKREKAREARLAEQELQNALDNKQKIEKRAQKESEQKREIRNEDEGVKGR